MTDMYRGYDRYMQKTTRKIPVVLLNGANPPGAGQRMAQASGSGLTHAGIEVRTWVMAG
jgi:hypothetical protein